MRTSYPTPAFSDGYQFKLVDSTFIHAIHLARNVSGWGNWTYNLGVSFQSNQDEIKWYTVKDPKALYNKLTDPKQSPGFTFNNSVKGKPFTTTQVVDKPSLSSKSNSYNLNTKPEAIKLLEAWKERLNAQLAPKTNVAKKVEQPILKGFAVPKIDPTPLPKAAGTVSQSGYGALLDVCQRVYESSCISYLALGYNRTDQNFVVYYALKTDPQNILAFFTDDARDYRNWSKFESLGRYYNRNIKYIKDSFSVRAAAKA